MSKARIVSILGDASQHLCLARSVERKDFMGFISEHPGWRGTGKQLGPGWFCSRMA